MGEKEFKFNFRNVYDAGYGPEPDAQTRRDWVQQMGTPYPHKHVMKLFREARERHEKRKAAAGGASPESLRWCKRARPKESDMGVVARLTIDESTEEVGAACSEHGSEGDTTTARPPKALKQPTIDSMFGPRCSEAALQSV